MTFDLTTNRVPFGLLTPEERAALQAWPHGWECTFPEEPEWIPAVRPGWYRSKAYRGKPAPAPEETA